MSHLDDTLKLSVRQGETLPLTVDIDDIAAVSVSIIVKEDPTDASSTIYESAAFSNQIADLTIESSQTGVPVGEYIYQITVIYSDGSVEKYPDTTNCDDDCQLPQFIVCEALDPGVS